MARDALLDGGEWKVTSDIGTILENEADLAKELFELASADSRIGYEASNHYYYLPRDLVEKVIQCSWLKDSE